MEFLKKLNKAFDSRVRLGIMSVLSVNDRVDFNKMKEVLDITDGNLASHISALEKLNYVEVKKQFIGKKPSTTYKITRSGRKAFTDHLDGLEQMMKKQ